MNNEKENFSSKTRVYPTVKLTEGEAFLIADILNGTAQNLFRSIDVGSIYDLMGDDRFAEQAAPLERDSTGGVVMRGSRIGSGLEHEIYDALRLDGYDEKWEVDGYALLEKIRSMSAYGRLCVLAAVSMAWEKSKTDAFRNILIHKLVEEGVDPFRY